MGQMQRGDFVRDVDAAGLLGLGANRLAFAAAAAAAPIKPDAKSALLVIDVQNRFVTGAGFKAYVIEDASRGIDLNGSLQAAWAKTGKAGVKRIQSSDIAV